MEATGLIQRLKSSWLVNLQSLWLTMVLPGCLLELICSFHRHLNGRGRCRAFLPGDGDGELAILRSGLDRRRVSILRQSETAGKAALEAFNAVEAFVFLFLLLFAFPFNRQHAVIH